MTPTYPTIVKYDGTHEEFDPNKLKSSLTRSGASEGDASEVVDHLLGEIKDGSTTEFIYRHAFDVLKNMKVGLAARYSLRRSLAELGPTGFPFENFVAQVYEAFGNSTKVGEMVQGKCIGHEIDVIAQDDTNKKLIVCEAKFHNQSNIKSDLKVVLYVKSRYIDLLETDIGGRLKEGYTPEPWIVTNTKFTENARKFAECAGINLLGWDYPKGETLQDMIEKAQLEPITTLTTLSEKEKRDVIEKGAVLCRDVHDDPGILSQVGIEKGRHGSILEEVQGVCTIQ